MQIYYCKECINNLKNLDIAFELYQNICECYLLEGTAFSISDLGMLKFPVCNLENKGFLITTEEDIDNIYVKPIGISFFNEEIQICPKVCVRKSLNK
jgi:hypothetical protein